MDYVCKGNSLFHVFCKELHRIWNLVFEGLRSMSPILEIKPVKWLRPVLGWKWLREFRYVNSCIKPSSLFLSADVNGEILFVPCCWKYFCISAHQVTIKLLLIQNVSVLLVFVVWVFFNPLCSQWLPLLLSFEKGILPAVSSFTSVKDTAVLLGAFSAGGSYCSLALISSTLVIFPFWHFQIT